MKHRKKGRKLGRTASHKKALLSNLSVSLIKNKRIKTTEAKAKELRTFFEPLVTKAKEAFRFKDSAPEKDVHLRRIAKKFLKDKEAIKILFDEIGSKVGDRPGGYTRVLKTGFRPGDGANLAIIELVDYSFIKEKEEPAAGKKKAKVKKEKVREDEEPKTIEEKKIPEEEKEDIEKKEEVEKDKKQKAAETKKEKDVKIPKADKDKEDKIKKEKEEVKKTKKKEVQKADKKETKTTSAKKDTKQEVDKPKTLKSKKSDTSKKDKK